MKERAGVFGTDRAGLPRGAGGEEDKTGRAYVKVHRNQWTTFMKMVKTFANGPCYRSIFPIQGYLAHKKGYLAHKKTPTPPGPPLGP